MTKALLFIHLWPRVRLRFLSLDHTVKSVFGEFLWLKMTKIAIDFCFLLFEKYSSSVSVAQVSKTTCWCLLYFNKTQPFSKGTPCALHCLCGSVCTNVVHMHLKNKTAPMTSKTCTWFTFVFHSLRSSHHLTQYTAPARLWTPPWKSCSVRALSTIWNFILGKRK